MADGTLNESRKSLRWNDGGDKKSPYNDEKLETPVTCQQYYLESFRINDDNLGRISTLTTF